MRPEIANRDIYVNVKVRTLRELEGFVEQAVEVEFVRKNGAVTIFASADKGDDRDFSGYYAEITKLSHGVLDESDLEERIKTVWPKLESTNNRLSMLEKLISARGNEVNEEEVRKFLLDLRSDTQEISNMDKVGPRRAWLYETLLALGLNHLKSIVRGERVVFSTSPTRLQRPWPLDANGQMDRINRFCEMRNGWSEKYLPEENFEKYGWEIADLLNVYGGDDNPVTELRLVIHEYHGYFGAEISGFNKDGESVFTGYDKIDIRKYVQDEEFPDGLSFVLFPSEREELDRIAFHGDIHPLDKDSGLKMLAQLDQQNPLSGVVTRIYDFACEVTGNELVTGVYGLRHDLGEELVEARDAVAEAFQGQLAGRRNTLVVVEPLYEDRLARTYSAPKRALAEFARATLRKGFYTLDDLAGALSRIPDDSVGQQFFRVVTELGNQSVTTYPNMDIIGFRLYSMLSQQERALVKSERGLTLEFPNGNPALERIFESYVRSSDLNLYYSTRTISYDGIVTQPFDLKERDMEQTNLLADDRFWPAKIWLKIDSDEVFIQREANGEYFYNDDMNIKQMAEEIRAMLDSRDAGKYEKSRFTYATNKRTHLVSKGTFGSLDGLVAEASILERPVLTLVTFERLPKDIQKRVMEVVERLRREDGDGKFMH